ISGGAKGVSRGADDFLEGLLVEKSLAVKGRFSLAANGLSRRVALPSTRFSRVKVCQVSSPQPGELKGFPRLPDSRHRDPDAPLGAQHRPSIEPPGCNFVPVVQPICG